MPTTLRLPLARLAPWALLLALAHLQACACLRREVFSCGELRAALNDTAVDHVLVMPGDWNCTEQNFPPHSVFITNRSVLYESGVPYQLRMDMNRVAEQVVVGEGGNFTQRNLWGDDCYYSKPPYSCMVKMAHGGWSTMTGMQISDAGCVAIKDSVAISTCLMFYRFSTFLKGGYEAEYLDDRCCAPGLVLELELETVLIKDTGWLQPPDVNAQMRIMNSNFTCTGNVTHWVPPDTRLVVVPVWQQFLLLVGGLLALVLAMGVMWCWRRRARESDLPEHRIAESRGYVLEAPLGSGHYGRVYRGRNRATGQLVAVKVIDMLPSQRRQLLLACAECQLMARIRHDNVVRVHTFYAAQVQQRQLVVEPSPGVEYVELGFNVASVVDGDMAAAWSTFEATAAHRAGLGSGSSAASSGSGKDSGSQPATASGATATTSDGMAGVVSTQVQLVMQYCDMGTLHSAVKKGMFRDADGKPRLRHMLATALDIASGLAYMHHPERHMVHRDMSANNILLTTSAADDRGFRALLSDFGLSTVLSDEQTHKTSQVKGTLSYMSPEMFNHDSVSPALDIYSLGILMHVMFAGKDPYDGHGPAFIILSKVRAAETSSKVHLPELKDCPRGYQQLVWDLTNSKRHDRPSAAEVVQRVEALLAAC